MSAAVFLFFLWGRGGGEIFLSPKFLLLGNTGKDWVTKPWGLEFPLAPHASLQYIVRFVHSAHIAKNAARSQKRFLKQDFTKLYCITYSSNTLLFALFNIFFRWWFCNQYPRCMCQAETIMYGILKYVDALNLNFFNASLTRNIVTDTIFAASVTVLM
jgi:hypothetical protein